MISPSRGPRFGSLRKIFGKADKRKESFSSNSESSANNNESQSTNVARSGVQVFVLDSENPLLVCTDSLKRSMKKNTILVKDVVKEVCKQKGIKPYMTGFFNLQHWKMDGKKTKVKFLIPTKTFEYSSEKKNEKLILRYQFKVLKGRDIAARDEQAFRYYLTQCRYDFCNGFFAKQLEKESKILMRIIILLMKLIVKQVELEEDKAVFIQELLKCKHKNLFDFEEILRKNPDSGRTYEISRCRSIIEKSLHLFDDVKEPEMDFLTEIELLENYNIEIFHLEKLTNTSVNPIEIWVSPVEISKRVVQSYIRRQLWQSEYKYLESCQVLSRSSSHGIEFSLVRTHEPPELIYCKSEEVFESFCSFLEGYYQLVCNQYDTLLHSKWEIENMFHGPLEREVVPRILSYEGRIPGNYLLRHPTQDYSGIILSFINGDGEFAHVKFNTTRDENEHVKYELLNHARQFDSIDDIIKFYSDEKNVKELNCVLKKNISPRQSRTVPVPFYQDPITFRPPPPKVEPKESLLTRPILLNSNQLGNEIGKGSYGKVYRALCPNGEEIVRKNFKSTPFQLDQWIEIAGSLRSLDHPNIIKYIDSKIISKDEINLYFEYLPFGPLQKYLSSYKHEIHYGLLLKYVEQIASAIEYLHCAKDIIHADICSEKILVQNRECVKLNHQSFFVQLNSGRKMSEEKSTKRCRYYAPELILKDKTEFTKYSDYWSFGITMWEMFSLRLAFNDFNFTELQSYFEKWEPANLSCLKSLNMDSLPYCDEYLNGFFDTVLNIDPVKRGDIKKKIEDLMAKSASCVKNKKYYIEDWATILNESNPKKSSTSSKKSLSESGNYTADQSSEESFDWSNFSGPQEEDDEKMSCQTVESLTEEKPCKQDVDDENKNDSIENMDTQNDAKENSIENNKNKEEIKTSDNNLRDDTAMNDSKNELNSKFSELSPEKSPIRPEIRLCERHSQSLPPSPSASAKVFRSLSMEQSRSEEKQIANILVDMQRGGEINNIERSQSEVELRIRPIKLKKLPPPPPDSPEAIRREFVEQPKKNVPSGDMTRRYLQERINQERDKSYGKRTFSFAEEYEEYKQNTNRAAKRALLGPNPFNLNVHTSEQFFIPSDKISAFKPLPKDISKYFEESKKFILPKDIAPYKSMHEIRNDIRAQTQGAVINKFEDEYTTTAEVQQMMKVMKNMSTRSPTTSNDNKSGINNRNSSPTFNRPFISKFSLERTHHTTPTTYTFHNCQPKLISSAGSSREKPIQPKPTEKPATHISQIHIPNASNINVPILINNTPYLQNSRLVALNQNFSVGIPPVLHRANAPSVIPGSILLTQSIPSSAVSSSSFTTHSTTMTSYCIPASTVRLESPTGVKIATLRKPPPNVQPVTKPAATTMFRIIKSSDLKCEKELGSGNYGNVFKGEWYFTDKSQVKHTIPVAIKKLRPSENGDSEKQLKEFQHEAELLAKLSGEDNPDAKHIVKLFGVCGRDLKNFLIVTEYATEGSLLDFTLNNKASLSCGDLLYICQQISRGMKYLHSKKYIHRDLACRNVLVFQKDKVKLCDFGLSRMFQEKDYYRSKGGVWPIPWLAIESIMNGKFSRESDYWSFGVLVWELFTLYHPNTKRQTCKPYAGVKETELPYELSKGLRLSKPDRCPEKLWPKVARCWNSIPEERPSFTFFITFLHEILREMNFTL